MPAPRTSLPDRLRCLLLGALPQHALSRLAYRLARIEGRAHRPLARWFARRFGVDLAEAEHRDIAAYPSFNDFFTRGLRAGARPQHGPATVLTAPVDGRIAQLGRVQSGRLLQAKGSDYSLTTLLGGDTDLAQRFDGHPFATLYLAPGDYHRVHMPLGGRLRTMVHVPGRLYPVGGVAARALPGLFTRNERLCCVFDTEPGPLALVLVGAIHVGAIETVWAGQVTPPRGRRIGRWNYPPADAPRLRRGDEMGRFNMGSTVIVLAPDRYGWCAGHASGNRVRVGMALAEPSTAECRA